MNNDENKNRYICFDVLKCLCAFMVVCIHKGFYVGAGPMRAVFRIAVPCFFAISGFFYQNLKKNNKIKLQKKKIFKSFVLYSVFYFFYSIFHNYLKGYSVLEYLDGMFSFEKLFSFLLFNYHPLIGVIWYLGALLYTLIVIDFLFDRVKKRIIYYLPIPLITIVVIFGTYFKLSNTVFYNNLFSGNFIFSGIPYFIVGMMIFDNEKKIKRSNLYINLVFCFIFICTSFVEYFYFKRINAVSFPDVFASTFPLALNFILLIMKFYKNKRLCNIDRFFAIVGKEYSAGIYYVHIVIKNVYEKITDLSPRFYKIYQFIPPIFIYFSCIMLIYMYRKFRHKYEQN